MQIRADTDLIKRGYLMVFCSLRTVLLGSDMTSRVSVNQYLIHLHD